MTLLVAVALAALGALSAAMAPVSAGAHAMLGSDHPAVRDLEDFSTRFAGGQPVLLAWECGQANSGCGSALDVPSLRMARAVGDRLAESSVVARVSSPAHSPLLRASQGEMQVHWFVKDGVIEAPPEAVELALGDPLWRGALISSDGQVGAIVVEAATSRTEDQEIMIELVEATIAPFAEKGFRFFFSGYPWIHVASFRGMATDGAMVGAATIAVLAGCFFLLLQSWQSVLSVIATIGLATGVGLLVFGFTSWPWDPIMSAAPTMVLVLGSADAVHFLTAYWRFRAAGRSQIEGLRAAAAETSVPCAMTSATSAAGLLSFIGTEALAIAHFGVVAATGVLGALVFTFSVLPASLLILPDSPNAPARESIRWDAIIGRLAEFPIQHRRPVLLSALIATVVGVFGVLRLNTDANALGYWKSGDPTRTGIEFVSQRLTSIEAVEVEVRLASPIDDGEAIAELSDLEAELRGLDGVREVKSVLTVLDRVADSLGLPSYSREGIGELITVVSLGDSAALDSWLSFDHKAVRVSVTAAQLGVDGRERLLSGIRSAIAEAPKEWAMLVTGPSALQQAIDRQVEAAAIQSVSASSLLVTLLVMLFLRSFRWGALAMIPNLVPMIILFGIMGIWGIALDGGSAVVAPIAIGVAVDDTIHFLHAYAKLRRGKLSSLASARGAALQVGRAMATTSGTLALGFLTMLASRFQSAANIGLLSAAAIVSAFVAELLVLPALLAQFRGSSDSVSQESK
jgi:predicted RND superfamily exporter protein